MRPSSEEGILQTFSAPSLFDEKHSQRPSDQLAEKLEEDRSRSRRRWPCHRVRHKSRPKAYSHKFCGKGALCYLGGSAGGSPSLQEPAEIRKPERLPALSLRLFDEEGLRLRISPYTPVAPVPGGGIDRMRMGFSLDSRMVHVSPPVGDSNNW